MLRKVKFKTILLVIGLVFLVGLGVTIYMRSNLSEIDSYRVKPVNLKETILAAGRVEELNRTSLSFSVPGHISRIYQEEGDMVSQGELLAELTSKQEETQLRLAEKQLEAAQSQYEVALRRYDSAENQYQTAYLQYRSMLSLVEVKEPELLEKARLQIQQAEINYNNQLRQKERTEALVEAGVLPSVELEEIINALELTRTQKDLAQNELNTLLEGGSNWQELRDNIEQMESQLTQTEIQKEQALTQVTQEEIFLSQAQIQIEQVQLALENQRVYSPLDGQVHSINKKVGEYLNPGETLFEVSVPSTDIIASVDEKDYQQLNLEQRAYIKPQSDTAKLYEARAISIASEIDAGQGIVEVSLEILEADVNLKPNSSVTVEFIVEEMDDVLAIPIGYLAYDDKEPYVWLYNKNETIEKQQVLVEKTIGEWVVVDSAFLKEGDILIFPSSYQEGQKVNLSAEEVLDE